MSLVVFVERLRSRLDELKTKRFWGEIVIKIRDGEVSLIRVNEDVKPENL